MRKRIPFVLALLSAASLLLAACQPAGLVQTPQTQGPTVAGQATPSLPLSPARSSQGEDWRGFPVGFTSDGYPYRGQPAAPLTLTLFGSYASPFAARFAVEQIHDLEETYVRDGKARLVYRHYPMQWMFSLALPASQAAECAARQGAAAFWQYHDELYRRQYWWTQDPDPQARFQELAAELGLDVETFAACLAANQDGARIETEAEAAKAAGIAGVPSLAVNQWTVAGITGLGRLQDILEAALAGQPALPTPLPGNPSGDILTPERTRPGFTVLGDAYLGNLDAPIGFMLFDDPQSESADAYRAAIVEPLIKDFVDAGRIWLLYRHMTEKGDMQAQLAGEAMECAGRQQAFWPMREWLLANRDAWSSADDPAAAFGQAARSLELDGEQFDECLAAGRTSFKVRQDRSQAFDSGLRVAPQLVLFSQDEPRTINHDLPYDALAQLIEETLAEAASSTP